MRFIALFEDTPEMMAVRAEREAAHLAYLRQHASEIRIAGGLREDVQGRFVGGLWVLEVSNRDRAVELIESDPYWVPEHRSYRLLLWGKAFDDPVTL
jgi:uncharacterized protein YciI